MKKAEKIFILNLIEMLIVGLGITGNLDVGEPVLWWQVALFVKATIICGLVVKTCPYKR